MEAEPVGEPRNPGGRPSQLGLRAKGDDLPACGMFVGVEANLPEEEALGVRAKHGEMQSHLE